MLEPALVGDCVAAMRAVVPAGVPVTVKCRLGVDEHDDEAFFRAFIDVVAGAGCKVFVVHARKAWLHGLSPKQNREIPPLDHDRVLRLKRDRPELTIVLNGGIRTTGDVADALEQLDGVMLGRVAYHEPYLLTEWQQALFANPAECPTRAAVLGDMRRYIAAHLAAGGELRHVARHLLGLYQGEPGARSFRRTLSEARPGAGLDTLDRALACVERGAA
jgi:tRNA-dihydrouridine synthase A